VSSTFWLKAIIKSIEYGFQPIRGIVSISPGALPQAMVKEAFGQTKLVKPDSNCLTDAKACFTAKGACRTCQTSQSLDAAICHKKDGPRECDELFCMLCFEQFTIQVGGYLIERHSAEIKLSRRK